VSSVDIAARRARLSEAYLGHRLNRTQLRSLLDEVDQPEEAWNDKFEIQTASRVKSGVADSGPKTPLEELGLVDKYHKLDDDSVWTAEDRAIHRHISKLDRPRHTKSRAEVSSHSGFLLSAQENFDQWDRDHNLLLDSSELDFAMSGGFYGQNRQSADEPKSGATLALLMRHSEYLQGANPLDGVGVSKSDLLLLEEPSTDILRELKSAMNEDYQDYLEMAHRLVERKTLEQENIDPKVIHQGVVGSCVLLSTLAGVSKETLQGMLSSNSDGTFQVAFADGSTEQVHEPTVAERLYHAKGDDLERWPALIELAMAQRLYHQDQPKDSALRSAINGIAPEEALKAITGSETDRRNLDELSVNQTRQALTDLTSGDGPVICGSRPTANGDFISTEELKNGIQNGHCYTVLGFDPQSDSVTLRNPWGRKEWEYQDSPDDGVFEMPTHDFYASFRWIAGALLSDNENRP
jgi:calpain family cysteine protease